MKKYTLLLIIIISIINFASSSALQPAYNVIVYADKPNIDPGEILIFNIWVSGAGEVKDAKILLYTNPNFNVSHKIINHNWTEEIGSSSAIFGPALSVYMNSIDNEILKDNPDMPRNLFNIRMSEFNNKRDKIFIQSKVSNTNIPGDNSFTAVLSYMDNEGNWYSSKSEVLYHIRTPWEEYWIWAIAIPIVFSLIISIISLIISVKIQNRKK